MAPKAKQVTSGQLQKVARQIKVLRVHFDKIDREAWDLIVERRIARDRAGWARAKAARKQLWADFDAAETLILEKLTSADALSRTRRELETARKKAVDFNNELKRTKMSLARLEKAVSVVTATVATLTEIIR